MSKNYTVSRIEQDGTQTQHGSKAKKGDAIALADADRASSRRTNIVRTHTGTVVHEVKGVRPMRITPRFSKLVEMPEGVEVPEGARPAYLRLKHDAVIVAFDDAEKDDRYGVVRVSTGKLLKQRFGKTRDAGQFVLTLESPKARAKRLEAEKAEAAQADAPAEELANA